MDALVSIRDSHTEHVCVTCYVFRLNVCVPFWYNSFQIPPGFSKFYTNFVGDTCRRKETLTEQIDAKLISHFKTRSHETGPNKLESVFVMFSYHFYLTKKKTRVIVFA